MAKLSMKLKQQAEPKFSTRQGPDPRRTEGFLVISMVSPDRMHPTIRSAFP